MPSTATHFSHTAKTLGKGTSLVFLTEVGKALGDRSPGSRWEQVAGRAKTHSKGLRLWTVICGWGRVLTVKSIEIQQAGYEQTKETNGPRIGINLFLCTCTPIKKYKRKQ